MSFLKTCNLFNLLFFSMLLAFIFISGCEKGTSPIDSPEILLTVSDVGVTEAWLHLEVKNSNASNQITILRGDSTIQQFSNFSKDSIIYDQDLLPGHSYTYKAIYQTRYQTISVENNLTTLDTTSHDFTWEMFNFGDGNSSVLRDVFIINSDDIWAVGEIYLKDSTGQTDPQPYGAIHWDGIEWRLMKIPYHDYGSTNKYPGTLKTVFAFDSNNVYVTSSANLLKWDGNSWTEKAFFMTGIPFNGQVKKMWASSENDIYCVGNGGAIYHYKGQNWQRIESGTDLRINDIWGNFNKKTGEYEILCVASNHLSDPIYSRKILEIKNNQVIEKSSYPIQWTLYSVWFIPQVKYFVAGGGIYEKHNLTQSQWQNGNFDITSYYIYRIRGNQINDIIAVGGFGEVVHFNGLSWKSYFNETNISGNYYSIDFNGEIALAVGYHSNKAVITIGNKVNPD